VHAECRQVHGSPHQTVELNARGIEACENTLAKAMRQASIAARRCRRFLPTTIDSNHPNPIAPNLQDRQLQAQEPDRKWVCDITCVRTANDQWLYMAAVMNPFSRTIVGSSMAEHLLGELVNQALEMALASRHPGPGLLHHSHVACSTRAAITGRSWRSMGLPVR
jgi:putative transposase